MLQSGKCSPAPLCRPRIPKEFNIKSSHHGFEWRAHLPPLFLSGPDLFDMGWKSTSTRFADCAVAAVHTVPHCTHNAVICYPFSGMPNAHVFPDSVFTKIDHGGVLCMLFQPHTARISGTHPGYPSSIKTWILDEIRHIASTQCKTTNHTTC